MNDKLLSYCLVCRVLGTVCDEGGELYSTAVENGIDVWLTVRLVRKIKRRILKRRGGA
jgi:hypothetical protein